jgi:hypothetical protein
MANRSTAEIEQDVQRVDEQIQALRQQKLAFAKELEEAVAYEAALLKVSKMSPEERRAIAQMVAEDALRRIDEQKAAGEQAPADAEMTPVN